MEFLSCLLFFDGTNRLQKARESERKKKGRRKKCQIDSFKQTDTRFLLMLHFIIKIVIMQIFLQLKLNELLSNSTGNGRLRPCT